MMRKGKVARQARRTAAEERQAERDARGDNAQLHKLCVAGHGHCKEALRLAVKVHGKGGMEAWINDKDAWSQGDKDV